MRIMKIKKKLNNNYNQELCSMGITLFFKQLNISFIFIEANKC